MKAYNPSSRHASFEFPRVDGLDTASGPATWVLPGKVPEPCPFTVDREASCVCQHRPAHALTLPDKQIKQSIRHYSIRVRPGPIRVESDPALTISAQQSDKGCGCPTVNPSAAV